VIAIPNRGDNDPKNSNKTANDGRDGHPGLNGKGQNDGLGGEGGKGGTAGSSDDDETTAATARTNETKKIMLYERHNPMHRYNETSESYFDSEGNEFVCDEVFNGSIYYKFNETAFFKCDSINSVAGDQSFVTVPTIVTEENATQSESSNNNGQNGQDGQDAINGMDGKDGRDGRDGMDGA
jgi:hypothetical protein